MAKCAVCNQKIKMLATDTYVAKDGSICPDCVEKIQSEMCPSFKIPYSVLQGSLRSRKVEELKTVIDEINAVILPEANCAFGHDDVVARFDDDKKLLSISKKSGNSYAGYQVSDFSVIPYDDILSYELLEDGGSLVQGGIGRAVAGGLLFGGAGAIIGAATANKSNVCSSLEIKLTLKDNAELTHFLSFVNGAPLRKDEITYKQLIKEAQNICAKLENIFEERPDNQAVAAERSTIDPIEELRRYKALVDEGVITQEDFEKKKKKILDID